MKNISFIGIAIVAALSTACGHASFQSGSKSADSVGGTGYTVSGTSYQPEAMVATLSNAHVQETNANTYGEAVRNGSAFGYMGGMTGGFRHYYCPNGVCIQPPAPPVNAPAQSGTNDGAKPSTTDGAKPATKAEIENATKIAKEADKKATAAVQVLKNLREQGKLQ